MENLEKQNDKLLTQANVVNLWTLKCEKNIAQAEATKETEE